MGLGFLTLVDSIDGVFCPGSDAWSYRVSIHSCVVIPHCIGISCGIFLIPQGHDFFSLWDL